MAMRERQDLLPKAEGRFVNMAAIAVVDAQEKASTCSSSQ
jgi:hypothetical protein